VAELETGMSDRELRDWALFDATCEPLPDRLIDIHFAQMASLVCNLVRSSDAQPITAQNFYRIREHQEAALVVVDEDVDEQIRKWRGE
jgi:hypothetical protein